MRCGPYTGAGRVPNPQAWTARVAMSLEGSAATMTRGDANYAETLAGTLQPDLSMSLRGEGAMHARPDLPWHTPATGRFDASRQARFDGTAVITDKTGTVMRNCTLDTVKAGT